MDYSIKAVLAVSLVALSGGAVAVDDRYIVKFTEGRAAAGRAALHAANAQDVLQLGPQNAVAAHIPAQALPGLSRNPNIEYIEIDEIRTPFALSDKRLVSGEVVPYGIQMVQADLIHSTNEQAMKICIIDSGYSQQHADLKDADAATGLITFSTSGISGAWDTDSCGHGTHVAGTIAATAGNGGGVVGVIPGARLHIVKVFGNNDLAGASCSWTYSSTLVDALNKCEGAGAKITSMSLGGNGRSKTEEMAFNNAYKRGMLHVAAAGNAGTGATSYPAGYPSVISVAAVDANENAATFSQRNSDVELSAPGVAVLSTTPWLDDNTLTFADASTVSGTHIEGSARTVAGTSVSGIVADGGFCDSPGAWPGMIVACRRGNVSFNTKVQNVEAGGGVVAIVYNTALSDPACGDFAATLGSGNSSAIPALAVSCDDGSATLAHNGQSASAVSHLTMPGSGYEAWDGTSMATPHVSGVAALVWSCFPTLTNQKIRDALNATARDRGASRRDPVYGYGIVQAKAAVASLGVSTYCPADIVSR